MALTEEWKRRIKHWEKILWGCCYRPIGSVDLAGFTTRAQLTAEQALTNPFQAMSSGTHWGTCWDYGWFKASLTLPPETTGQRLVLRLEPGGESLVWVNGQIAGSVGWAHREMTLSTNAQPGDYFEILLESYAGHGPISIREGPVRHEIELSPDPNPCRAVLGQSTYGVWHEDIYQLAIDFTTLLELREHLDPLLLRTVEIDQGLMDTTLIVDPELPDEQLITSARKGRERLRPLLDCTNGSTMPDFFAFGHAHIDVAWLWPLAETERKMARTIANQLALFDDYPAYRFLQSQPQLYCMLKARYPELYARLKTAVDQGRIIPDGTMWVEADTNLTGGESLIRQITFGRRFFQQEFGVDSRILWLPDVFGYSAALPQILMGCGCLGFATAKITWAYNGGDPFPYNVFLWEGIDGTTIPAHIFSDYNSHTRPSNLFDRWNSRLQQNGVPSMLLPFGWGDGGGGPTRDHLEFLERATNLEGLPRVHISSPAEFFQDLQSRNLPKERYVGELYFQAHRGTYTSQAKTKQGNRRSEFALREAEFWGTTAARLNHFDFTSQTLAPAWRQLLLMQFHDILPGSSIHRVYEEAEASFEQVITAAESTAQAAASSFTDPSKTVTVFNSLSWPRTVLLELPSRQVELTIPACGWKSVPKSIPAIQQPPVIATSNTLENEYLLARFDSYGELVSLFDKETQREMMSSPGNRFILYHDVPGAWDAWDIDSMAELQPVNTCEPVTLELISAGPLVGRIKLHRRLHQSTISQIISLRHGSHRIEFSTAVDWHEKHKLLKVSFPFAIHATEAIHEIQFGHLRRPSHRSRRYDADRFEVSNHKWTALAEEKRGVAILNDSKYGLSVNGSTINLSLLKSPIAPDPHADQGVQTFTYAVYSWNGSFADCGVVQEAYELNCPPLLVSGKAREGSLFSLDAPNIILETVKPAEDGSGDIIIRLYESKHTATRCNLYTTLPLTQVYQTDMMEVQAEALDLQNGKLSLDFRPFEIKTIRLK